MTDRSLIVENLSKCYRPVKNGRRRDIWALKDVSFDVERGTVLGIVGPNGAGKTTLLKVLARITPPTEGRVQGRGRVVPLLALGAGFQRDLSGRDNVFLNAAVFGISAGEVQRKLDDIVEFAGIGDVIDQPVKQYSSGMYLRLAFSVAINMDPDILLADEVLAVGDLEFQERCLGRVAEASRQGITVLFVSHDMGAISRLCSRALLLDAGQIVRTGEPDEIISLYQQATWSRSASRRRRDKHELGELLAVRLTGTDGREIGAVRQTEDALLTIDFRIDKPGAIIRAAFDLFARGVLAFRTVQPEEQLITQPGLYSATVRIPAGLLAEVVYSVNAAINLRTSAGDERPLAETNAVNFRVFDTQEARSGRGTYRGPMPGMVAPRLEWQVVHDPRAANANV